MNQNHPAPVFPIRFSVPSRALALLGLTRSSSRVVLEPETLDVRMGWAFHMRAPRGQIRSAERDHGFMLDRGVHGWFGRWNVAASARGLVRITFEPTASARAGPFAVGVRRLRVSLEDPEGFLAALGGAAPRG